MINYSEKKEKYITLLLSLSIHILFILALLLMTHKETYFSHKKLHLDQPETFDPLTLSMPAALKPKASSFGAPLIFQEEPDNQPTLFDPHSQEEFSQDALNNQDKETPIGQPKKDIIEPQQPDQDNQPQTEQKKMIEQESSSQQESLKTEQIHLQELSPEKTSEKNLTQDNPQVKLEEKNIEPKVHQKKMESQPQQVSRHVPDRKTQSAGPIKRKLTFADLAQGFIESIKNEGEDWIEREGDPNKRPDIKDLKYISYVQKLIWHMQNEWKAEQSKLKLIINHNLILTLIVTILKDGTLGGIQIVQPSGSNELDSFLIKGIEKAAPYPSVPNHFNTDSFDFPLAIHNTNQESSPWKMRLPTPAMHLQS
jgi:outer membrane biosynthesis protein TonB